MDGPLKWHGGKHYLAPKFVAMMPTHTHYVEPYFGGGSTLLAKSPQGVSEVVNDLYSWLAAFWGVLANPELFAEFMRHVTAMPFAEPLWNESLAYIKAQATAKTQVADAVAFFICCRQSMAGKMKNFAPLTRNRVRRAMNEQASAWLTTIEGLPAVHERLKSVVVLNHPALDVIRQQDGPKTLFYLDPPYLHETRATTGDYTHEMSADEHHELLEQLACIDGKFMLSGYESKMYAEHQKRWGWNKRTFDMPNNAAGGKSKRRMTECVWMNF